MQNYHLTLKHSPWTTFRCQKAANSLDIDVEKKLTHDFSVSADIESPFNVGVIVGASGSGKTTLAEHIWGAERLQRVLTPDAPVIEQFPTDMDYSACVKYLTGVGLSAVTCWIRPASTLSNGQRERAEIALRMASSTDELCIVDEWTSVVDRTVGKVMSHAIQKWARASGKRVVLLTCHYDVLDWLQPDWVIDCNKQAFIDRRLLPRQRQERLTFDVRECDRRAWSCFAKYHYLSDRLPAGFITTFGLFCGEDQVGFLCFAQYTPHRRDYTTRGIRMQMHSNRTVIHPDFVGLGLGMTMTNAGAAVMHARGFDVRAKYSSEPMFRLMIRDPRWEHIRSGMISKVVVGARMSRLKGHRLDVTTHTFKYVPETMSADETGHA